MKKPLYNEFERRMLNENNSLIADSIKVKIAWYKLCRQIGKIKAWKFIMKFIK